MGRCVCWDTGSLSGARTGRPHTPLHSMLPCTCCTMPDLGPAPALLSAQTSAMGKCSGCQKEAVPHIAEACSPFPASLVLRSQAYEGRTPQGAHGWTWFPKQRQPPGPQVQVGAAAAELRTWLPPRPRPLAQGSQGAQLGKRCSFQGPPVSSLATGPVCGTPGPAPQCSWISRLCPLADLPQGIARSSRLAGDPAGKGFRLIHGTMAPQIPLPREPGLYLRLLWVKKARF